MKRVLALLLAVLMCSAVLVSCGNNNDDPVTTTTTQQGEVTEPTGTTTESPYDANGYLKDDLDPSLNYANKTINILYWSDVERHEFEIEQITGDLVDDAIYNRNMTVENRLGVTLNWVGTPGNYGNQAAFVAQCQNDVNSGGEFNIFAGYSLTAATIALNGLSRDLMQVDNLNFEQPWWPASLIDQATINGKLYFCSGDISTNMLHMMYACVFNKDQAEEYGMGDLYKLVRDGEWTLDKMIELCEGTYRDLDGNNEKNDADHYGFATTDLHYDALFTGSGLKTIEKGEDGLPAISPSFGSTKTQALLEKMVTFINNGENAFTNSLKSGYSSANALRDGRAIIALDRIYITSGTLKDVSDFSIGVLPVPKWDAEQKDYVTCMAFPYTIYSISTALSNEDADMTGAVLECLGSEGYRQVTPALFETSMKLKYASGQDDSDMYDLIRSSIYIDLGRIFTTSFSNVTYSAFRSTLHRLSTNWASVYKGYDKVLKTQLKKVVTTLEDMAK